MSILRQLPNVVTGMRLGAVPVTVWLIVGRYEAAAFWVVLAAGLSDALDGYLAKRFDAVTRIGTYLDPIADKALLIGAYLSLSGIGLLPAWLVVLAVSRDALIVAGVLISTPLGLDLKVEPILTSKLNTVLQIALVVLVLGGPGVGIELSEVITLLICAVSATTVVSGSFYLMRWMSGFNAGIAGNLAREGRK